MTIANMVYYVCTMHRKYNKHYVRGNRVHLNIKFNVLIIQWHKMPVRKIVPSIPLSVNCWY